jgi:hypothetical protein
MKFHPSMTIAFLTGLALASGAMAAEHHDQPAPSCAQDGKAEANGYWLDAELARADGAWKLTPSTNIRFAPQQYGGAAVTGEGHIHLYLNGKLIGPVTHAGPISLPLLDHETYVVRLALATSDHKEAAYGVCREIRVSAGS